MSIQKKPWASFRITDRATGLTMQGVKQKLFGRWRYSADGGLTWRKTQREAFDAWRGMTMSKKINPLYTHDQLREKGLLRPGPIQKPSAYLSEIYDGMKTVFSRRYNPNQIEKLDEDRRKFQTAYKAKHPNAVLSASVGPLYRVRSKKINPEKPKTTLCKRCSWKETTTKHGGTVTVSGTHTKPVAGLYCKCPCHSRRNPGKATKALKRTGGALKGAARGILSAGADILGAGAEVLNPKRTSASGEWEKAWSAYVKALADLDLPSNRKGKQARLAYARLNKAANRIYRLDPDFYNRVIWKNIHKIHSQNPTRRIKVRNKYIDLVIRGYAQKTAQGWRVGKGKASKTIAQGRGTAKLSSGYYLDKATGAVYAKRERNIAQGFYDASGFHPMRESVDYLEGQKASRRKAVKARIRKAASTWKSKHAVKARKATTSRLAGRSLSRSSGMLKKRRNTTTAYSKVRACAGRPPRHGFTKKRRNLSAEATRKTFAGRYDKDSTLAFPDGTPAGKLAKLGKLVLIQTEAGTIKPVNGTAWLCADSKGKLHIGSVSKSKLFSGPAQNFGKVTRLEYEEAKPHLGYGNTIWFHRMGEETGERPTLHSDGKGGLHFRGGRYRLTKRGIEN